MNKRLYRIVGIFLLIFVVVYGYDFYRSKTFGIETVAIEPQPAYADGKTPVNIRVHLRRGDRSVSGHDLYAVSLGGGNLKANRVRTDSDGNAEFIYFPYIAGTLLAAEDVPIQIIDESNSIFFEVNTTAIVTVELVEPEAQEEDEMEFSLDDIFGG